MELTPEDNEAHEKTCPDRFKGTPCSNDDELEAYHASLLAEKPTPEEEAAAMDKWLNPDSPENELLTDEEAEQLDWSQDESDDA